MAQGSHTTWAGYTGDRHCHLCGEPCTMTGKRALWIDIGRQRVAHTDCAFAEPKKWRAA